MKAATRLSSGKERVLLIERGNTRSQSAKNSIWKRLCTCRETHKKNE
jgi:hypothetical protein